MMHGHRSPPESGWVATSLCRSRSGALSTPHGIYESKDRHSRRRSRANRPTATDRRLGQERRRYDLARRAFGAAALAEAGLAFFAKRPPWPRPNSLARLERAAE